MTQLKSLFSPFTIKDMELSNRAVMPPMGTALAERGGVVSEALLAYLRRQAVSGAGLLISEITAIHPSGVVGPTEVASWDDSFIPGLKQMAEAMHSAGSKAAMQLHHAGRESFYMLKKGKALGPSALSSLVFGQAPKEMTIEEIQEIITAFGAAARRAREAGFDAVEIHGAHGYLLTQFLSTLSNQRRDEYGGAFADRARFVIEVVRSVRKGVGEDFPVLLRISAEEYIKMGYTIDDVLTILPDLKAAGVDAIHASIGTHGSPGGITSAPANFKAGWNIRAAEKIKASAGIPVIGVGRFTDPRDADQAISAGNVDLIAFGRQHLCDPDYLEKAKADRYGDIRICIACNQGCIEREMYEGKSVRCAINPETGQELDYPKSRVGVPCNVWVVGAGPAGLTAAYEAHRLGHAVTLFEKESSAGGNILYACKAPHKEVYHDWIQWLVRQVEKAGVKIQTGTTVTDAMLEKEQPEAVILATGGEKIIPAIEGGDLPHVCDAWQILGESIPPARNVLVVGGGLIGMEVASFAAEKGSVVTLIEQLGASPVPKYTGHGYGLHKYLREKKCLMRFGSTLRRIRTDSVTIAEGDREVELDGFEQVVLAVGMKSRDDLKANLVKYSIPHKVVGDAFSVRRIMEATEEGAGAAWNLPFK